MRFPEFKEEWKPNKLGNLLEFKNGINASKEQYGKGVKFINVLDILNNDFIIYENIVGKVDVDKNIIEKFSVQYGDVLFQRSSETREEVGTANVYLDKENNATFGGFVIRGKKIGNYNPIFFNKLLKTSSARDSITSKSGGSTRFNVGQEILSSIVLYFPSLIEQDMIAGFLSLIDNRISTQRKIIEKLETSMRVSRVNIFSQKLRFKDEQGYDFPDWKKLKLGEIGSFQTSSIDKLSRENENEVYLVNYMNVYRHEDINSNTIKSFQKVTAKEQQIISCNLRKGDILFTPSSETPDDIGHSVVISENLENAVFSYHLMRFRPKIEINILYSNYFCNVPIVLSQLSKFATGSTRFTISVKSFSNVEIVLPTLSEQKVIGDFFSLIEKKIETEKKILAQYETQKKYLLANLFI
ncbi:restriction endonuclease subunit S [Chryseobacterium sp. JM1]|uniref:restriction endonuclease subunit S n=1 Tax=Chryseobacterium sp. JM1 TaxID=1233950 RepID=UPI00054D1684|nr:restriction endonuclease subunit S [Chryseobacterium sp. JM1]